MKHLKLPRVCIEVDGVKLRSGDDLIVLIQHYLEMKVLLEKYIDDYYTDGAVGITSAFNVEVLNLLQRVR